MKAVVFLLFAAGLVLVACSDDANTATTKKPEPPAPETTKKPEPPAPVTTKKPDPPKPVTTKPPPPPPKPTTKPAPPPPKPTTKPAPPPPVPTTAAPTPKPKPTPVECAKAYGKCMKEAFPSPKKMWACSKDLYKCLHG